MRKFFQLFSYCMIFALLGCDKSSVSDLEKERQQNMAIVNAAPTEEQKEQQVVKPVNTTPLHGMAEVVGAALELITPQYINKLTAIATPNEIAMCAALEMKIMAYSAMNPGALEDTAAKVHGLTAAGTSKAYETLKQRGLIAEGALMQHVNNFKPMHVNDVMSQFWSICDHMAAEANKEIDQNQFRVFIKRPYSD